MADIVVEYDQVDTDKLAKCVLDLERRGYHIWLDLPDTKGSVTREALKKRFETQAGLYAIYSEGPIGLDDLHDAIQQFGTQQGDDTDLDSQAATLFACLKGSPKFPASFRRICAKDMESPADGMSMRKSQPGAVVSVSDDAPRPGLIIEKMLNQQSSAGTETAPPAFQVRLDPSDVDRAGMAFTSRPQTSFSPSYSQPEPVISGSVPPQSTTVKSESPAEKPSRLQVVHNLAGTALLITAITFVTCLFTFADGNRPHLSVIAIAAAFALVPFVAYRFLRNYEHRLRAEERSKREIFQSPLMV